MPAPAEPAWWTRADIEDWIRRRRGRTDTEHSQAALAALTGAREHLNDPARVDQVRTARAASASWSQIGAALGMTKQGAWSRFHAEAEAADAGTETTQGALLGGTPHLTPPERPPTSTGIREILDSRAGTALSTIAPVGGAATRRPAPANLATRDRQL